MPNGDFEDTTGKSFPCSWLVDRVGINEYVYNWFTPIGTTTDVMSTYADDECWANAPNTGEGKREPHSGEVMIGFINYSPEGGCQPNEWHEYFSVQLSEKLVPGNVYCLEFWVALGANSKYATNNIGALFTTKSPERNGCMPMYQKPQVNVDHVINNTKDWVRIEMSFLADSTYEYLTMGNFFTHDETIIETQKGQPVKLPKEKNTAEDEELNEDTDWETDSNISFLAYYFMDDVALYLCPSVNTTKNNKAAAK